MQVIHADQTPERASNRYGAASQVLSGLSVLLGLGLVIVLAPWPIRVVDGDTVDRMWIRYRLAGFDAPELRRPKCARERERAQAAKARLEELLAVSQRVDLVRQQWRLDPWGRVLARLEIDGQDLAVIATREGWGAAYHGRGAKHDWCGE